MYYKGFEYLIRAMKGVREDALLILGGDGPLSASFRALAAAERVEDRIIFAGRIPDEDLPAYYHASDIFVCHLLIPAKPSVWCRSKQ